MKKVHLDFESRSRADIWKTGAYVYATDPSTEIMCLAYAIDNGPVKVIRWTDIQMCELIDPFEELRALAADKKTLFYAHNALFEQLIWSGKLTSYGLPKLPINRWRCTAAKALAHGLPKALKDVAATLGSREQKDLRGRQVMLKVCKPKNDGTWEEDPGLIRELEDYCAQDVETEREIDHRLPELDPFEQYVWFEDQLINQRGIAVDKDALEKCLGLIEEETANLKEQIVSLTDGKLEGVSRRAAVLKYFKDNGVVLPDFTKATVETALRSGKIPPDLTRVLQIRQELGLTSTAKYKALEGALCSDSRLRDILVYHSAGTGRWCMPGDAEVLTQRGWERMDKFSEAPLLAVRQFGRTCVWDKKAVMNVFDYTGEMVELKHKFLRGLFTPEHRFTLTTGVKTADGLKPEDCLELTVNYGAFTQNPIQTRVKVMIQADAHIITNKRNGRCLKFHFKKTRKIERAKLLLDHANIFYTVKEYACGTEVRVRWCDLPEWARQKHFGADVLDHSPAVFIDELKYWDSYTDKRNHTGGFEYTTTNAKDAEWVLTMAHLAGVSASIVERKRQHINWSPSFRVHIRMREYLRLKRPNINRTVFSGQVYCPTTKTGFFLCRYHGHIFVSGNSGKLVQMQNLPKGTIKDTDAAVDMLKTEDLDTLRMFYGGIMGLLSSCVRGMFVSSPGHDLIVADYAAIEARVAMWFSGQDDAVKMFHEGVDIYVKMAERIGAGATRQLGKQAVLGCGYGMGHKKFRATCANYKIEVSETLAEKAVSAYRTTFSKVPAMWYAQERAVKAAITTKKPIVCGKVKWQVVGEFLYCTLPSGRKLAYHKAQVKGDRLSYMTTNSVTKKYQREETYGGKIFENIIQAIARDILAAAMLRAEKAKFKIVLTVHDELVAEVPERDSVLTLNNFINCITRLPKWAENCPISAEGWRGKRYKK